MPNPEPEPVPSRSPSPPEDIAAAMGFSSFGAKPKPPKKKRKLADPNSEGSGSNNTPLGVRTRKLEGQQAGGEEAARGQGRPTTALGWGGAQGQERRRGQGFGAQAGERAAPTGPSPPDALAAEALDETAAMLLGTGQLPQYLDWSQGFAEGGPRGDADWKGKGRAGGQVGGVAGEEMRRQGKRGDGEWDWQALRRGVVVDERGDVAFYDGSFVEDPWRGLLGA